MTKEGATAVQLGKSFPLYVLAQIAWKDFSKMIFDTSTCMNGDKNELACSKSLIATYLSHSDCKYVINYFENSICTFKHGDCYYLDLNINITGNNYDDSRIDVCDDNHCDNYNHYKNSRIEGKESGIERVITRIGDYFYDNYKNVLNDCYVSDISIIKYISNGKGYSGLHSENYHIDGKEIVSNSNVDGYADYIVIVFLNDDFTGGDLQFIAPNAIHSINAQTGNGVLFGGGLEYSHRVLPVTGGHRYVVKMVFNKKQ